MLQAKIDYNNSKAVQLNQLALIDQRRQSLNQLMNVAATATYKVSDTIPVREDILLNEVLSNFTSPELELARVNIDAANLNVRLAKTARYPTVSLVSA